MLTNTDTAKDDDAAGSDDRRPGPVRRRLRRTVIFAGPPVVLVGLLVGAWYLFGQSEPDRVAGHVELAGVDLGGMTRSEARKAIDRLATRLEAADVQVTTPDGRITLHPKEIGLQIDRTALLERAFDAGRGGMGILDPFRWARGVLAANRVEVPVELDRDALQTIVTTADPTGRLEPVEPTVEVEGGTLAAIPGIVGHGIRSVDVADAIVAAGRSGVSPIRVTVHPTGLPPRFADADAQALLGRAAQLTGQPVTVQVAGADASIPAAVLESWLTTRPNADRTALILAFADDRFADDIPKLVGNVGAPAAPAAVAAVGDKLTVVPGTPGTRCCSLAGADLLFNALDDDATQPIDLPLTDRSSDQAAAEAQLAALTARGVKEKIGEFTTNHAAGESRVINIHRIADLVRGHVVEPGAAFSVNNFIGPRTTAKGFVSGGVIENLVFSTSVGGGISQFATTLFNAAFFGGLDFDTYQSHSIYISRYPYGREATLSFPSPDLVIRNTTPYPVFIWTEYTDTSITVSLWSTRYATGAQTGQSESPAGACTRVRTERTRTYVDGHKSVDDVYTTYQPAEGKPC